MALKSFRYICATLCLVLFPSAIVAVEDFARIVGGDIIPISNAPYLVQLWKDEEFICAGSLIAEDMVLTSAHCLVDSKAPEITVVGGASTLSDAGVSRKVVKISRPKAYSEENPKMDVAVMKLESPMEGDDIATIPLNDVPLKVGQIMQVSGYGLKSEFAKNPTGELHTIFVPILTRQSCADYYKNIFKLPETMFCAAKAGLKDHCFGDSGGPAVSNGKLCGIVSRAVGCARIEYPGIYVGTLAVSTFINNAMANLASA
ncbi:seminase-like [Haematobia irritans]|uniref:seminase-like n=1 Tax=Haematobia irritans TaxID=7368 RepID=UPI003F4FF0D3